MTQMKPHPNNIVINHIRKSGKRSNKELGPFTTSTEKPQNARLKTMPERQMVISTLPKP
jgi:hypothetical protein